MPAQSVPHLEGRNRTLAERIHFMGGALLVLFVLGWCAWFYPYDDLLDRSGTPFGADFSMFYVAGRVVLDGDADQLYDQAAHDHRLHALFPGLDQRFTLPYRYPPFVGLMMAPLAALPYATACTIFMLGSVVAGVVAVWLLANELEVLRGSWRRTIILALSGWPVALETVIGGQATLYGVLILATSIVLMCRRKDVLAGAVLALAIYKPNLLLLFGVGCVVCRPRMLIGAIPVAIGALGLSWATCGADGIGAYLGLATELAADSWDVATPYWKVHGLSALLVNIAPGQERLVAVGMGFLAVLGAAVWWRSAERRDVEAPLGPMALLITINALANPYTPIYDLALLGVGALLTAEFARRRFGPDLSEHLLTTQLVLATLYFGPHISQFLSKEVGIQAFTFAMLFLAAWQVWLIAIASNGRTGQFRSWDG